MLFQPHFRALQLLPHVRAETLGINRQKRRIPLAFESLLDDPVGILASAERNERLRCSCGNAGVLPIFGRQPVPIIPQRFVVHRLAFDAFNDSLTAQLRYDRTFEHPAFFQLRDQRKHAFPVHCHLLCAQLEPQRRGMFLRKLLEYVQRVVVAALVEQHFGLRHQLHGVLFGIRAARSCEILVAGGECAHAVCGTCGEHCGKRGRFSRLECGGRRFFRPAEAALEKIDQRFVEGGPGAAFGAPLMECPHARRHGRGDDYRARKGVGKQENPQREDDREVERKLGTPRRQHHQYITVVVARRDDQADRNRKQPQHP